MSKIVEYGEAMAKGEEHLRLSDIDRPSQGTNPQTCRAHAATAMAYFAYAKELREATKDGWW